MNYRKGLYRDLPNLKRHTQILIFHICPKGFRETIYGLAKTLKRTHICRTNWGQRDVRKTPKKCELLPFRELPALNPLLQYNLPGHNPCGTRG